MNTPTTNENPQPPLADTPGSGEEWEDYDRIRPEEAKIGDEFYGRMLTWEAIKTRFQVTGVQVQKASCRRKRPDGQSVHGLAFDADRIRREHAEIAASYEAQLDTTNGIGLPYGPCQCPVCRPNDQAHRPEASNE